MKTAIEKAIKLSIEGGYKPYVIESSGLQSYYESYKIFLDPLFWQALGKAMGWEKYDDNKCPHNGMCGLRCEGSKIIVPGWMSRWHRFIDALASGQSAESFFKELLK